jgi:hypothetical protein
LTSRIFTAAVAALTLLGAAASSVSALAQPPGPTGGNHSHGSTGGGGTHTAAVGGGHGGGGGYRGHGGGGGGIGAFGAGIVLGAVLGNYAGHPYYCRGHHHWRWSNRRQEYVYDYRTSC